MQLSSNLHAKEGYVSPICVTKAIIGHIKNALKNSNDRGKIAHITARHKGRKVEQNNQYKYLTSNACQAKGFDV